MEGVKAVALRRHSNQNIKIEPTVTLFRVFQTLYKQGNWFSFTKCCAPSPRHLDAAINDPRLLLVLLTWLIASACNGNVMGIHDFLCLPEWTGAEVQEEPHLDVKPTLQRLPFTALPMMRPMLLSRTLLQRILPLHTRSALAQSSDSTTRPSLFASDDDACVEIPLVTPFRSAAVIPSLGNQGGSFIAPTTEGSNTRDSQGKGIMVDDATTPSGGAKGNKRKKKIKSLSKILDNLHFKKARLSAALNQATILEAERDDEILWLKERLAEAFPFVAQTDYAFLNKIYEYAAEPLSVILKLEPEKLAYPANVPILRDTRVSPLIAKVWRSSKTP
uniref:Uncharacterized protein n=1 Tax=Tanacetum cinerariifolium TaxID=118510 RepID=A0A6L2P4D7_TANCI|nr:hypothetical protein [Tanacetum cinerariifolium]